MQLLLNRKAHHLWRWRRSLNLKTLLAMKMLCVLMLAASLQVAARGYSQGISITLKNEPLEKLFMAVEQQSNFRFVYSKEAMELSKPVTIDAKNETLENILKLGFSNQPLTYSIDEKFIIVKISDKKNEAVALFHDVNGRVVNENGEGVIATITEKGTTNAASTDADGYFQLKGVNENATLIVTGVGIETMEIKVAGKSNISISVKTKITGLAEVIINKGYYSTSQKLNTGNVSKVTAEIISKQPVSNPLAALEGRMPGVYIQQTSGVPGSAFNIQIRGRNSIRIDGNNPLYIVDGIPFTSTSLSLSSVTSPLVGGSPLNTINPADIESIEVLKDADATAIYGSRGGNGVVLITTKRGKQGKTRLTVNAYGGIGEISRKMDLLNTEQYLEMRHEAFLNDAVPFNPWDYDVNGTWDTTRNTDWQKVLIGGTAKYTDIQSSISGGNTNTQFLFGGGFHKETTVFPGNFSYQKASGHFNLTHTSENKKFNAILSAHFTTDKNNQVSNDLTGVAMDLQPNAPAIYTTSGSINWENNTWANPFAYNLFPEYKSSTDNLLTNAILSYQIIPCIQIKMNAGYTKMQLTERSTEPIKANNPAWGITTANATFGGNNLKTWLLEPQAAYNKKLGQGTLSLLIGTTFQQNLQESQVLSATGFTNDVMLENIQSATTVRPVNVGYVKYRYNATFGRVNYNWKEKYIINLIGRRDGSSKFGSDKQFANFGAVGAAWIFSTEELIRKKIRFISYGKIRTSFGSTGNDQIPDYGFLSTYSPTSYIYQGPGLIPNRLVNPDYSWEVNKKFEVSIDLGFLKDRILLSGSYYRNRSSNQLVGYSLPVITGFSSIQYNLPATVQNSGVELEFNSVNIKSKKIRWTTSINLSFPKNKLIAYPNIQGSSYANTYVIGKSLFVRKLYHYTVVDPQTGIYQFEDVDKDNQISYPNDLQTIKEVAPKFYGGVQNIINYKSLQLDMLFQFSKQDGFNYLNFFTTPGFSYNQPSFVMNRWTKAGNLSDIQKFTQRSSPARTAYDNARNGSDKTISDASFVRLKNIALSWQLDPKWIQRTHFETCRIYIQSQNLFTITKYKGFDPENQNSRRLPPLRVICAGLQFTL